MRRALIALFVFWPALAPAQVAVLSVSPSALAFDLARPGVSAAQAIHIRNTGSGALRWRATAADSWVRVSPGQGVGPSRLEVRVDATSLKTGRHESRVTIDAGDADDSPASIVIVAEVADDAPAAPTSPPAADTAGSRSDTPVAVPSAAEPGPPAEPAAPGADTTAGPLRFTRASLPPAARNLPYAQAVPVAGGSPPYTIRLVQGRLPNGLVLSSGAIAGTPRIQGVYPMVLAVTDSARPPATVTAALPLRVIVLFADTALTVSPPSLTLTLPAGRLVARGQIGIASGRQPLEWSAAADVPWLRVIPASGTAPGVVHVEAAAAALERGAHSATITVVMDGVPNSPARIPVTVVVQR